MLTEQKQESALRPFRIIINQFDLELTVAREELAEWEKARSIDASGHKILNHDQLSVKIQQFEKGKHDTEKFVSELRTKLQSTEVDLEEIENELQSSKADFTMILNEARSLSNYGYTILQKNEINRRITTVNSSRMLNNADMEELQKFWTGILSMKNDRRLAAAKKMFEDRLNDWENLIAQKKE